jgi:predicted Ser/Thr protein kinase
VKEKREILQIVEECYKLDNKLTGKKEKYYVDMKQRINEIILIS